MIDRLSNNLKPSYKFLKQIYSIPAYLTNTCFPYVLSCLNFESEEMGILSFMCKYTRSLMCHAIQKKNLRRGIIA